VCTPENTEGNDHQICRILLDSFQNHRQRSKGKELVPGSVSQVLLGDLLLAETRAILKLSHEHSLQAIREWMKGCPKIFMFINRSWGARLPRQTFQFVVIVVIFCIDVRS